MTEDDRRRPRRTPSRAPEDGPDASGAGGARGGGGRGGGGRSEAASRPDVFLEVPKLEVEHIGLEVEDLRAKVSLQAEVLNLLKLNVGVDAQLGRVALEIDGVQAEATLKVRLDEVAGIIDRVLDTIDRNPQIIETIARTAQDAVQEVGSGVGDAVGELGQQAGQAVGELGQQAGGAVGELGEQAGGAVGELGEQAGGAVGQVGEQAGELAGSVAGSVAGSAAGSADPSDEASGDTAGSSTGDADDEGAVKEDTDAQDTPGGGRSRRSGSTGRPRSARRTTG